MCNCFPCREAGNEESEPGAVATRVSTCRWSHAGINKAVPHGLGEKIHDHRCETCEGEGNEKNGARDTETARELGGDRKEGWPWMKRAEAERASTRIH